MHPRGRSSAVRRQWRGSASGARGPASARAAPVDRRATTTCRRPQWRPGGGAGTSAKNRCTRSRSFSKRCCVISPLAFNTAICDTRLCKSTPTCTVALASFLSGCVGPSPLSTQPIPCWAGSQRSYDITNLHKHRHAWRIAIGMGGRFHWNTHLCRGARNGSAVGDPAYD